MKLRICEAFEEGFPDFATDTIVRFVIGALIFDWWPAPFPYGGPDLAEGPDLDHPPKRRKISKCHQTSTSQPSPKLINELVDKPGARFPVKGWHTS